VLFGQGLEEAQDRPRLARVDVKPRVSGKRTAAEADNRLEPGSLARSRRSLAHLPGGNRWLASPKGMRHLRAAHLTRRSTRRQVSERPRAPAIGNLLKPRSTHHAGHPAMTFFALRIRPSVPAELAAAVRPPARSTGHALPNNLLLSAAAGLVFAAPEAPP
jgi:hypothetical protein